MAVVEINWNPAHRQLRQFGFLCLVVLPLLGWFWGGSIQTLVWLGITGLVFAVGGMFFPQGIKPLFLALSIVTTPIGMVLGELVMLMVYVGVFLPIGIVFRLIGRDSLQLKQDRQAKSYWQSKQQPEDVSSYYRQS